jgi:hypothetical protein
VDDAEVLDYLKGAKQAQAEHGSAR